MRRIATSRVVWASGCQCKRWNQRVWNDLDGPDFLAVVWFGSSPTPFPSSFVGKLSLFLSLPACRRSLLLTGEVGEKGWARSHIKRPLENADSKKIIQNSLVAKVVGSFPASSDTLQPEGRQMKQCWKTRPSGCKSLNKRLHCRTDMWQTNQQRNPERILRYANKLQIPTHRVEFVKRLPILSIH